MRNRIFKSVVSVVLTLAILISSDSLLWSVFAVDGELPVGLGIYNNVYTSQESTLTKYTIVFKKHSLISEEIRTIEFPSYITLENGKTLTKNDDGSISVYLNKGEQLNLTQSDTFNSAIRTLDDKPNIFEITYVTGYVNNDEETSVLYSERTQVYNCWRKNSTTNPISGETTITYPSTVEWDLDDPFENLTDTIKQFDSTTMTEVTVEQEWRDRGTDTRPMLENVKVDLYQGEGEGRALYLNSNTAVVSQTGEYVYTVNNPANSETYHAYMTSEQSSSTTYQYTFTVPEFAPDGTAYTYTSDYSDKPEGSTDNRYPVDFKDLYKQGDHPDGDLNKHLAIGLTDFTFTLNWKDAAVPAARPEIDLDYIKSHFKLYNQSGEVPFVPDSISEDELSDYFTVTTDAQTGVTTITVKRLEDLTANGTANEYYVILDSNDGKVDVRNAEGVDQSDYYAVKASNTGIHGSEFDKAYINGAFEMLLTGKTDFTGTIKWEDVAESLTRSQDPEAASLTLWRYLEKDAAHYLDYSAIVTSVTNPQVINGDRAEVTVRFTDLDKYDNTGNSYHYYGVENVTVEKNGTLLPYSVTYTQTETQEGQTVTTETEKLENGGTVTNKLSDKVEFSVSAEWIAAARQGGTASATYQLQRKKSGAADWTTVLDKNGNNMERTLTFDELHMKREGDETCIFEEVDLYDEHGNLYEYRVVQTSVTRKDELPAGDNTPQQPNTNDTDIPCESAGGAVDIEVNDKYHVVTSVDGTDFHFQYNIEGDTKVNITKRWIDKNGNPITTVDALDSNNNPTYKARFTVQNYNNSLLQYVDYFRVSDYNDGEAFFAPYIERGYLIRDTQDTDKLYFNRNKATFQSSDGNNWTVTGIEVPKYDKDGREIAYRPVEIKSECVYPSDMDFYSRYAWSVRTEYLTTTYEYVATNYQTSPGDEYAEMAINKEWVDDGEQEYRKPIKIVASENVYHKYVNNQPVPTSQSRVLDQSKVWEDRLAITYRYQRDANNNPMTDGNGNYIFSEIYDRNAYNSSDFREMPADLTEGDTEQYYWDKSDISGDDDETKWIRKLLTGTKWGNIDYSSGTELNSDNSTDLIDQNGVKFDDFAGIYKSRSIDGNPQHCHYYAVRQVYDPTAVNGAYATLRFINTRIGVISYEVKFDWKVGDALTRQDNPINKVTLRITGEGLPEGGLTQDIRPENLIRLSDGTYAYYILNLPKYDEAGKLIEYKIEEIKIGDSTVNEDGEVRVGSDNCVITVSDETIIEGSEAKTDDLHSIKITNTFADETDITVHKRWADNTNAENTRSDLFLKLHRRSARPGATEEDSRKEYEWRKSELDSDNEWSYTFSGLPKYDDDGYPYTYYVTEQDPTRIPGYKQLYQTNAPYKYNDYGTPTQEKNEKVYLDPSLLRNDVAYDGGIITNRLYGELTINGEKLWKNVSLLLQKNHYPIAHVSLYRTVQNSDISPHMLDLLESEYPLNETEISEGRVLISETDVMNGENSFKFESATKRARQIRFVVDDGTGTLDADNLPITKLENGNIVLPKYDNVGRAIEYTLEEEPLNGYLSKIVKGSTKLINDFQGGVKLKFDVTKKWEGMENQEIFPTITFTLFQVFRINNGTEQNPDYSYILMNHFDRVIQSTEQSDVTVHFGDSSHPDEANYLRYYAPTGEPYIYFVAETLSNYGGDRRLFIDRTNAGYISDYLTQNYPGGKSQIVYLDNNSGQALGFTSTVEQTFGSVEDIIRARVVSEPEPTTAEPATVAADPEAPTTVNPATLSEAQIQERLDQRVREALNDKDGAPVELNGAIKNTYVPDDANFHGKIDVSKDWDNANLHEGDQDNFSKVRSYSFALSRKTEHMSSQTLFRVLTKDSLSAPDPGYVVSEQLTIPVPEFEELAPDIEVEYKEEGANAFTPSMTMPDSTNRFGTAPAAEQIPKYFVGVLRKDGKDVTVVVQVGEEDENDSNEIKLTYVNKVHISGFAIYGHDAMKYTYTVSEDNKSGYTRVKSSGSTQLVNDDSNVPEIELENKINVFNIKLHKAFAKEYDDNGTTVVQPLKGTEYNQFFNEANSENSYFGQLKFNLMRSSVTGVSEPVVTVKGTDILTAITEGTHDAQKDSTGYGGYSYTISNLPITDVSGRYYTYWVEEDDGAQSGANPKVYTVYSDSEFARVESPFNSAHDPNRINMTDNDNGTTKDTYVQNVFKAKQIAVNKYWLDNNNEDGLRPDKLKVYVNEKSLDENISVVFDLELNKEDSVGTTGWKLESALARYYYNGTEPEELKYRITEETPIGYSLVDTPGIYGGSERTANLNLQDQSNRIYEYGSGWTDYAQADETGNPDTYYMYFRNTAGWSKVNACVWKDGVEMQWPGKTMQNLGNDIFRLEVPRDMTYVVFSNRGNSTAETVLPDTVGKIYENGSWVDYYEEDPAQSDSYYYVYFRNTDNWNKVNIYAWDDGNSYKMSQWPGTAMTDMGGGVYRMIVPLSEKGLAHVIFNDFTTSSGDTRTYEIPGPVDGVQVPVSDTLNFKQIGVEGSTGGDTFDQLNLTNYKELRKGQMTLDKEFDPVDDEVKALTRPDCLYFKLVDGNGSDFTDYSSLSGVTEKTFHFLNRYTPLKDTLTVNKNWIDDGTFYTWTRPDSVYVDLCYSIDGGDRVNLYTAGNDDPVKKLLKQADANYSLRKEIKATDNWTGTHYPVTYTIKQPQGVQIDFDSQVDYDTTGVTFGNANDTSTLWTTTVSGVPVYDRNGNAIEYTVEEISAQHYGYHQSGATVTTQEGVHTGNGNYYDTYQITNSLPVTDVTAVKHWAGSTELYPNTDVKVNLTRKSNNVIDRNFDEEETITYVDDGTDDSVTYTNLLAKDYNNNPYTYTVTEQMVRGYTTNYGNQNVLSTAQNRTVTITNTPITNDAYFVKYDVTDLEKHGSDSRFGLRAIPNAQFELYRVRENQADKKFWATGSDGIYNIAEDNAAGATSTLVTGTGGRLNIYGLEPNRYYLQEIGNPNGYQHTDTKFYFTVSVDENNQQSVIYVSQLAHKVNGKLLLDYDPFTADAAKNTLTEFIPNLIHGIPNEENMSHLTLTKVDANNSDPNTNKLPNATYYLLRLYNYEYRKSGAEYDTKSEYLTNALATLGEDYSDTSNLWTYWEKIAVKSTDSNGQITFDGHMFGTYVFYEVKAPTGYERDFTHNNDTATTDDTTNPQNTQVIGPVYLDSHNADHGEVTHSLTHLEPRSKAHINVLKTDENGNPLKNAVFKLYRKGDDSTVLTTFTTGYDGMNPTAFEIDTSQYAWGTEFYLTEETPPIGYDADNVPVQNRIEFTLTPELAEEVVHIVRANDVRLKGKADLTKVSSSQTTTVSAGDPLGGAQFELYAKDGNQPLSLYPHTTNTNTYRVVNIVEDDLAALAVEGFNTTPVTMLTTSGTAGDELGKLHIEGLDWGDYYLLETQAPTGYKTPAGEDAKVYFSVGRTNSGSTAQQLTMKNDPDTASLNITKQIDAKNVAAWGEPVFIFKVKQTKRYDYANDGFVPLDAANQRTLTKTISPSTSVTEGYRDSTGKFDVEPGTYSITEMRVARYSASGNAVISEISADKVLDKSVTPTTATLSVKPGGEAEITFSNQLKTYEKLSHADKKTNTFNGYKALEVHDKAGLALSPAPATNMYTATVEKSALTPQLIRSDGTKTDITSDFSKLVITRNAADTEFTLFDNGATITIKGRREDLAGSSYKLTATYDNKFTDEFELSFSPVTLFDKTEKTVVFRNDALNRSHYMDGENETNIYSLMFVLETGVPGETVKTVLHNGTVLNSTDQSVFPTPVIESDYSGWEFDKWSYSYSNGGTVYTAEVDNAGLLNAIKTAPNNAEIIVTAVLKVKSS